MNGSALIDAKANGATGENEIAKMLNAHRIALRGGELVTNFHNSKFEWGRVVMERFADL